MDKEKIRIGVVMDIICPWCYIGKRRLEKAIAARSHRFAFEVEYYPFELNPHLPEEGTDYHDYLCRRFGSEARFQELTNHVKTIAAGEGLNFQLENQKKIPNTRNAHRLLMLAREEGNQSAMADALFRAYFTEGQDLTNIDTLVAIGSLTGMDAERLDLFLKSDTGKIEIEMAEKELHDLGITSVPLYIIDNRIAISGAQSVERFIKGFEEAAEVVQS